MHKDDMKYSTPPPETPAQLVAIEIIEDVLNVDYSGSNIKDASEFISVYMEESKRVAEERKIAANMRQMAHSNASGVKEFSFTECKRCQMYKDIYHEILYQIDVMGYDAEKIYSKKASKVYNSILKEVKNKILKYAKKIASISGADWNY